MSHESELPDNQLDVDAYIASKKCKAKEHIMKIAMDKKKHVIHNPVVEGVFNRCRSAALIEWKNYSLGFLDGKGGPGSSKSDPLEIAHDSQDGWIYQVSKFVDSCILHLQYKKDLSPKKIWFKVMHRGTLLGILVVKLLVDFHHIGVVTHIPVWKVWRIGPNVDLSARWIRTMISLGKPEVIFPSCLCGLKKSLSKWVVFPSDGDINDTMEFSDDDTLIYSGDDSE